MKKSPFFLLLVLLVLLSGAFGSAQAMTVTLAWDANSETDLKGYNLYYSTTSFQSTDPVTPLPANRTKVQILLTASGFNPSAPQWIVSNLPNGKYYFGLTAFDSETPSLESGFSNIVIAGPVSTPITPPKNLRVAAVVAQSETIMKLVSDPIPGAEQLKVYVVGEDWKTIPYSEISYKNQLKAEIIPDLGDTVGTRTIYVQALSETGESTIVMKKVSHTINSYEFYDNLSVIDKWMWW